MGSGEGSAPGEPVSGDAWSLPDSEDTAQPDRVFGTGERYERRGELGRGGMGRVWAAKDRRLRREVALKEAHTPALARRMAREAWITGHLEHPGIVPVYDAGHTASGTPYYTMRLIRGRTLQSALANAQTEAERLALIPHFHDACQAMAYAHSVGIVHRDLKPANILVGEFGETQVGDWGLARPIQDAAASWSEGVLQGAADTQVGSVVGTPRYMAPEQALSQPADARSDVWSLGMVLFELLAGAPAYASRSAEETLEQVRTGALPDLDALAPHAPVELRAVVRHACQRDPARRYPSALELAQDVERWLDGRQVRAHDYTPLQLMARLVRAWRAPLVVATVAGLGLLTLGAMAAARIAEQRDRAEAALAEADRSLSDTLAAQSLASLRDGARPEAEILAAHALLHGEQPDARGVLAAFASTPRPTRLSKTPLAPGCQQGQVHLDPAAGRMACIGGNELQLWSLDPMQHKWTVPDLTVDGLSWGTDTLTVLHHFDYILLETATGRELARLPEVGAGMPVHLDAERMLSMNGVARNVLGWDGTAAPIISEPGCVSDRTEPIRDGDRLLIACRLGEVAWMGLDGRLIVKLADLQLDAPLNDIALQGDRVLIAGGAGSAMQLDAQTGELMARVDWPAGSVMQAVPIPDTDRVLLRGHRGEARVWHPTLGLQGSLPAGADRVANGHAPGQVLVFSDDLEVWQFPVVTAAHSIPMESGVASLRMDPRGEMIAVATGSSRVTLLERGSGERAWRVHKPGAGVAKAAEWSPNGSHVVGAFMEAGVNVYDRDGVLIEHNAGVLRRLTALSDGRWVGLTYGQGVRILELGKGPADWTHLRQDVDWIDAAPSTNRDHVVVVSREWEVCTLSVGEHELRCHGVMPDTMAVDVDDTGSGIWVGRRSQVCKRGGPCTDLGSRVLDVALSPDASLVAAGTMSGDVALLDADTLELRAMLRGHTKRTVSLDWSADGQELVSGSWDASVRIWNVGLVQVDPVVLTAQLEQAWGMTLDQALR
jgi:WD40 repeat protein